MLNYKWIVLSEKTQFHMHNIFIKNVFFYSVYFEFICVYGKLCSADEFLFVNYELRAEKTI